MAMVLLNLLHAQNTYSLKGLIIDELEGIPMEGVVVDLDGQYTYTSSSGEFEFNGLNEGLYSLSTELPGYENQNLRIDLHENKENLEIILVKSVTKLDEVVVLGKTETQKMHELPSTIIGVSEEYLRTHRENSLMQTLNKLPGVSSINIGSGQSKPIIRGLGFNRVSVFQNGIKHESQQWGSDHGLEIDQYAVDKINILKGASSLAYGSDAIGGVVDIQTPKIPSKNSFLGEVNLLAEDNNDLLGISTGIEGRKEKWFYRSRITYRDYADYKVPAEKINYESYIFTLHKNRLRNTAGREANAAFSIGYKDTEVQSETFFSNVYAKNGFFANAHGLEVQSSQIDYDANSRDIDLPYHSVNHFKVVNNTTFYKYKNTLQLELGFQNNYREELSEPTAHGYMPKPDNSLERIFRKNTYSLNIRDDFKPNAKHHIVFGLNTEYQQNTIGGWGFLIPEYNRFTLGIFAIEHFDISDKLHFQGGLRYDFGRLHTHAYKDWYPSTIYNSDNTVSHIYLQRAQNKRLNFNNFSGSLGLSYTLRQTTFKLNIGKSFRIPLANELASDGVNYHMYRYEKGNPDLDAEESYQADIDIEYNAQRLNFRLSPFINLFNNFIYLNPTPQYYETLQIYEYTQSKVFRWGAEISLGYQLFKNLSIDSSIEYVRSTQRSGPKKGFTIPFSPPLSALISANYQLKKDLFFLHEVECRADFRMTATQDQIVPPEEKTKGYQVLDLSLISKINIFNNQSQLRLKCNNIFNTKYFNHTSFYRLIDVPEAGRNLSLSLEIPF